MPRLVQTATSLFGAATCAARRRRGHIASRKGSANDTPVPRRKARREIGEAAMFMICWRLLVLEKRALNDFLDQRAKAAAFTLHLLSNCGDGRSVRITNPCARGIDDNLF